jgi:hypothetical protein
MNLGISNTHSTSWKRFKAQQIAAAASVGLAVAAAIGGLTLRDNPAPSSPRAAAPAPIARQAPLPETFVYVVGSQAEAAELTNGIANASEEAVDGASRQIFVVDSLKAEGDLLTMQGELVLAGTAENVRFVDLRDSAPIPAFDSRPKATTAPFSGSLGLNDYAGMEVAGVPSTKATTANADGPVYTQVVTPEQEMLSTGMSLP